MGNPSAKRKRPEGMGFRKAPKKLKKNFKKQKGYHSSSESEDDVQTTTDFKPVNMDDSDDDEAPVAAAAPAKPVSEPASKPAPKPVAQPTPKLKSALKGSRKPEPPSESEDESEEDEDDDDDDDDGPVEGLDALDDEEGDDVMLEDDEVDLSDASSVSATSTQEGQAKKRKRNDPTAFATSMSKILSTKLTTTKRQDPVLSRSAAATAASKELADAKLEAKAKRKLHAEKREALEKGRVKDVLGLDSTHVSTAEIQETERRLQKTAQRGVVKLFNAVRAAQVKGEQARAEAKKEGVVGISQREERVSEMSKKGFLDLIAQGGKKPAAPEA